MDFFCRSPAFGAEISVTHQNRNSDFLPFFGIVKTLSKIPCHIPPQKAHPVVRCAQVRRCFAMRQKHESEEKSYRKFIMSMEISGHKKRETAHLSLFFAQLRLYQIILICYDMSICFVQFVPKLPYLVETTFGIIDFNSFGFEKRYDFFCPFPLYQSTRLECFVPPINNWITGTDIIIISFRVLG